jgi:hypothetical protein
MMALESGTQHFHIVKYSTSFTDAFSVRKRYEDEKTMVLLHSVQIAAHIRNFLGDCKNRLSQVPVS